MDKKQPINNFDEMLKQSLSGAKMPVPSGVWETVGSSIGAKTVVVAKVASIKLMIIKSAVALIITVGAAFGIYELVTTNETTDKQPSISNNTEVNTNEIPPTKIENSIPLEEENVSVQNESTTNLTQKQLDKKSSNGQKDNIILDKPDSTKKNTKKVDQTFEKEKTLVEPKENLQENKTEKPTKKEEIITSIEKPISEEVEASTTENSLPMIPNVFTPYELDGYNDCFKIEINNTSYFLLQIFNSKGIKVFESLEDKNCWDGRNQNTGQMCPRGFYTFKLIYELNTGFKKTERGELNIL